MNKSEAQNKAIHSKAKMGKKEETQHDIMKRNNRLMMKMDKQRRNSPGYQAQLKPHER